VPQKLAEIPAGAQGRNHYRAVLASGLLAGYVINSGYRMLSSTVLGVPHLSITRDRLVIRD
jgi:hypothetical protein